VGTYPDFTVPTSRITLKNDYNAAAASTPVDIQHRQGHPEAGL
jgi:hypothetical protein